MADDGGVVGWQGAATEAVHQSPRGVALPDLQVVVDAVGTPLQLEASTGTENTTQASRLTSVTLTQRNGPCGEIHHQSLIPSAPIVHS